MGLGRLPLAMLTVLLLAAPQRVGADLPVLPGSVRLDGLAAVVAGGGSAAPPALILRSDVELRARIKLSGESGVTVLGPLPEGLLGATLDELIGEVLIEREAERLGLDAPGRDRLREQRQALSTMAGGEARLLDLAGALGLGRREVEAITRRRAIAQGFLEANLVGTTEVTTAELERAYAAGGHPFADKPLEEVREELRRWLGLERTRCSVRRWVEGLRARAEVQLLVRYGRRSEPPLGAERCSVSGPAPGPDAEGRE